MSNNKKISQVSSCLLIFSCVFIILGGCQTQKDQSQADDKKKQNRPRQAARPTLERPTVLLVILDTVRRDRRIPALAGIRAVNREQK